MVKLTTKAGTQVRIPLAQYRDTVFAFADEIKAFYEACSPKIPPQENHEKEADERLWRDWEGWRHPLYREQFAQKFIQAFPEHADAYRAHLAEHGELLGHVFFAEVVSKPLAELLHHKC